MLDTSLIFLKDQLKAHMERFHCNVFLGRSKEYVGNEPYVLIHLVGFLPVQELRNNSFNAEEPAKKVFFSPKKAVKASLLFSFVSGASEYEKSLHTLNEVADYYYQHPVFLRDQFASMDNVEKIIISLTEITLKQQIMIFEKSTDGHPYLLYDVQVQGK